MQRKTANALLVLAVTLLTIGVITSLMMGIT
jgi:hypothetical protein